jgi:aminoglycoside phosphotransferase (APT) family kinase protein
MPSTLPDLDQIPLDALAAHLARHIDDFRGPLTVTRFAGGQSNPTYRLDTPTRAYVMRTKPAPAAQLLASAHAIEREFRVLRALKGTEVPVPAALLLCEDESIIGRAFYVMDCLAGRLLWDPALPGMAREARSAIYGEMSRVLAALHSVDVISAGLADFGRSGNYFERQIARWTRQYQASVTEPIPAMDRLMDWLPRHVPDSALDASRLALVHGDYRLDNLMFAPDEPRVIGVLDWELATLGHPWADLSYHCLAWHLQPGILRGVAGLKLDVLGIPPERHHVAHYCHRVGRPQDLPLVLADWNFYLAYNLFRLAGILQGVAKRIEVGTASSAQAREAAAAARPCAEMAWALAQRDA